MREFANKITLVKNSRGVYDLDTSKGCMSGILNNSKGCYNDCYAARYSKKYGYDFSKTILRYFKDSKHIDSIIRQINKIDMPFIRIGVTGDPSENWKHTIGICEQIKNCDKKIVIITKHWDNLTTKQLNILSKFDIYINTSISALDDKNHIKNRLKQYNRIKDYCKSILRIVSCDFKKTNLTGLYLSYLQEKLFDNENTLDTVLRVYKKNEYVLMNLINIENINFLGKSCHFSMYNKNAYIGDCNNCPEMCGIN